MIFFSQRVPARSLARALSFAFCFTFVLLSMSRIGALQANYHAPMPLYSYLSTGMHVRVQMLIWMCVHMLYIYIYIVAFFMPQCPFARFLSTGVNV